MTNYDSQSVNDLLSSLRFEFSIENPQKLKESQPLIDQVHDVFLSKWANFFPENKLERASLSIRNPIFTDNVSMKNALVPRKGIGAFIGNFRRNYIDIDGETEHLEGVSVIKQYPYKKGLERFPAQKLSTLLEIFKPRFAGNLTKTREFVERYYFQTIHSHESAHACSDENVPTWFQEIGARYYQIEVIRAIYGENEIQSASDLNNHKFYQELLSKYGDTVHSYFFGNEVEPKTKRKLLAESFLFLVKDIAKSAFKT